MTQPEVTVVVICFNDAKRLARAVASVQRQTLRNLEIVIVDDASTDDTEAVAGSIASADDRVRYERLEENSGGCSAPRNRGLDLARAPWVMFCDSDDEYERHACKNLLLAAERTGSDVVCGAAERIDVRTGRTRRWRPEVHDHERVVDALADLPQLLYDTISVNKIYRVDLLRRNKIRFPEGILFEDQLFTLQAMACAGRLAVVPQTVYRWYVDRLGEDLSITQRRSEMRNVDSRIAVNRRIDAFLDERGLAGLRPAKDEKFLRHDLYLYLLSMVEADDEVAGAMAERLITYVGQMSLDGAWSLRPALRVAIYHLLVADVDGVRSAMRFLAWASSVDATVRSHAGRDLWTCAHLDAGPQVAGRPAREWLDVTALGLSRIPFTQRRLLHRVDSFEVAPTGELDVRGRTRDYDGSLRADDALELRFTLAGGRVALRAPARWVQAPDGTPGWFTWRIDTRPVAATSSVLADTDRGVLAVAVIRDAHEGVSPVRSERASCPQPTVAFTGRVSRAGPDALRCEPGENGSVAWRATTVATARARRARWLESGAVRRLLAGLAVVRADVLRPALTRIARLLPARRLVVLDAPTARTFHADLAAISDALARTHPDLDRVWANRSAPDLAPRDAVVVERGSLRHSWLLARARWTVDDWSDEPGTAGVLAATSVAAAVPVRRVGLDDPAVLVRRAAVADIRRAARVRSRLLVASEAAGEVLARALDHRGDVVATGRPRLDAVVGSRRDRVLVRRSLDLPGDRAVAVYAPSARALAEPGADLLDVDGWVDRLGDRVYLVVAGAAGQAAVPTRLRWAVRDLASTEDAYRFLAAADLVLADYGPLVGDAAALDVPVVLFWPDRARFVERAHGVYPGVREVGPVAESLDELADQVEEWLAGPAAWDDVHGPARRAWAARWTGPADGRSAERAAEAIVGDRP